MLTDSLAFISRWVLLQTLDKVSPGIVNWKVATKPPIKMPFRKVENCNQVVKIGKQLKFSLVNIAGNDIVQGNKKLILGMFSTIFIIDILHVSCKMLTYLIHGIHKFLFKYVEFLQYDKRFICLIWIKEHWTFFSAYLWQLMRYNMLQLLKNLRFHSHGKEITDADILDWANSKVRNSGCQSHMASFKVLCWKLFSFHICNHNLSPDYSSCV